MIRKEEDCGVCERTGDEEKLSEMLYDKAWLMLCCRRWHSPTRGTCLLTAKSPGLFAVNCNQNEGCSDQHHQRGQKETSWQPRASEDEWALTRNLSDSRVTAHRPVNDCYLVLLVIAAFSSWVAPYFFYLSTSPPTASPCPHTDPVQTYPRTLAALSSTLFCVASPGLLFASITGRFTHPASVTSRPLVPVQSVRPWGEYMPTQESFRS